MSRDENVALVTQCVWASLLTLPRTVTTDAASAVAYGNVYTPATPILGGFHHQYVRVLGFG